MLILQVNNSEAEYSIWREQQVVNPNHFIACCLHYLPLIEQLSQEGDVAFALIDQQASKVVQPPSWSAKK